MNTLLLAAICLVSSFSVFGQQVKPPTTTVYLAHNGNDPVGSLFAASVQKELTESSRYTVTQDSRINSELEFFIEIVSAEIPNVEDKSAVSIVVEETMSGRETPWKWYHKIMFVSRSGASSDAKLFVRDMDARWCGTIKSSLGGCAKEELP